MSERTLDLVALAARAIQSGNTEIAAGIGKQLALELPDSATLLALSAALALSEGRQDAAIQNVEAALRISPENLNANLEATRIYQATGASNRAVIHAQKVLDVFPEFPGLQEIYAQCAFENSDYVEFLPLLHACLAPKIYLETGVDNGRSFQHARDAEIAIGIDPRLNDVPTAYHQWGQLFEMTSDDFFGNGHFEATCGTRPIDTAFIDGMHLFEFALRDFINIERRAHAGSTILIHDIIPATAEMGARRRRTETWMGDVWKIIVALVRHRPDLDITVIDLGPSGLAVIQAVDPTSTILSDRYDAIIAELIDRPLEHGFLEAYQITRIPPREAEIRAFLMS